MELGRNLADPASRTMKLLCGVNSGRQPVSQDNDQNIWNIRAVYGRPFGTGSISLRATEPPLRSRLRDWRLGCLNSLEPTVQVAAAYQGELKVPFFEKLVRHEAYLTIVSAVDKPAGLRGNATWG